MPVKRLTIQLDDYPDTEPHTSPPSSLLPKGDLPVAAKEKTDIPLRQYDVAEEQVSPDVGRATSSKETIGRTPSDLIYAFVNKPEFMATFLTVIAFLISVAKIRKLSDIWIPLLFGLILNAVWFGVSGVRKLVTHKRESS